MSERETFTCGDYKYVLPEDDNAEITRYRGSAEVLDIPAELDGHAVTRIGDHAFSNCTTLMSVTSSLIALFTNNFFLGLIPFTIIFILAWF